MRELNQDQLDILLLLYRFRFATSTLLTENLKPKHRESINSRLNVLYKHELIGKHYDKSFKADRKPAIYFLLSDAFPVLKQDDDVSHNVLKNIYSDKKASAKFVNYSLQLFKINNALEAVYGDNIDFHTATELAEGYDHFPKPLPNAFVGFYKTKNSRGKFFFLQLFNERQPFFLAARKMDSYIAYAKSTKWNRSDDKLPKVLFICESQAFEKRLQRQAERIDDKRPSDLKFYATTMDRLMDMTKLDDDIWLSLTKESDWRLSLKDL